MSSSKSAEALPTASEARAEQHAFDPWNAQWQAAAMERCERLSYCANPYGAAWRFGVTKSERQAKRCGQCLCKECAHREANGECDLVFGRVTQEPAANLPD